MEYVEEIFRICIKGNRADKIYFVISKRYNCTTQRNRVFAKNVVN